MHRPLLVFAVFFLGVGVAWGQSAPPDQAEQVRVLLERMQQLEKRVAELEAKQGAAPEAQLSASAVAPNAQQPTAQPTPQQPATSPMAEHEHGAQAQQVTLQQVQQMEMHYPSLQIRGFADVDFSATDQPGTRSGFNLGQLDLHLASALSPKITYFAEITLNAHPTDYTIEVERSIIKYDYNDYFKLSFGRYHTPIGYWNTAFHHGAWLQTTIDRPFIVKVGGTFTPVHFVGMLAEGNIPSGGLGLSYNVGLGNGRGDVISRPGDAGDNNNNRAWVAKIYARPPRLYGLEVGASAYRDKISLPSQDFREWIGSAYVVWTRGSPELLAEFDHVNHRSIFTNLEANSDAFYTQVAYRLPWFERSLKPYYRFEYAHMPFSEQVFAHQDQVESIVGLRYDISTYAAFKGEYRNTQRQFGQLGQLLLPGVNGVFFQTDFTF
jgi:hypothetical protein